MMSVETGFGGGYGLPLGTEGKKLGFAMRSRFRLAISACRFFSIRWRKKFLRCLSVVLTAFQMNIGKAIGDGNCSPVQSKDARLSFLRRITLPSLVLVRVSEREFGLWAR